MAIHQTYKNRQREIRLSARDWRTIRSLLFILRMYTDILKAAQEAYPTESKEHSNARSWYKHEYRQALRDAVHSFQVAHVIQDYNLHTGEVLYRDHWFNQSDIPKRFRVEFVSAPTAPSEYLKSEELA